MARGKETIGELLNRKLVSKTQFAKDLGVSRSAVWNWLRNENRVSVDMKRKICDCFGFVDDEGFPEAGRISWPLE